MISKIKNLLDSRGIEFFGILPIESCRIYNRSLFERRTAFAKSVIVFIIPYRASHPEKHNVSLYAAPRDYHGYTEALFEDLIPELEKIVPGARFEGMSDHSPINETHAAASAGLGVIGDNCRLINQKYGSYVFIGEIYTDAPLQSTGICEPAECIHCGKCRDACPAEFGRSCLSAITQKKGELSEDEAEMMRRCGIVWGCDICQEVCPMNRGKQFTDIEYFRSELIYDLDDARLSSMSDEEFANRAFSWRGRKTVERNLRILGLK